MTAQQALRDLGVVAVVRGESLDVARAAAWDAVRHGAAAVEVTYTVPDAAVLMRELVAQGVLVGAGTVLRPEQLAEAADAGARFAVSAVHPPWLLAAAREARVLAVPGCATPQDVWVALSAGAEVVKIFPATRLGGPAYVRDLRGPFPGLQVMASGGVRPAELADYRAAGAWCIGVNAQAFGS